MEHIKKTIEQGFARYYVPDLPDAKVVREMWGDRDSAWVMKIKGVVVIDHNCRTLESIDKRVGHFLSMTNHQIVELAYAAKNQAFAREQSGVSSNMVRSDFADALMKIYRDRVGRHVDGQTVLRGEE